MTYQDLFFQKSIIDAIPMKIGTQKLNASALSEIVLTQVAYQTQADVFGSIMREAFNKLKRDGFDERLQKHNRYEQLCERKDNPLTENETAEKNALEKTEHDFRNELSEINSAYMEVYNKKIKEAVTEPPKLSVDTFQAIAEIMDFNEDIKLLSPNNKEIMIPQTTFLTMIGYHLVEKNG